MIDVTGTHSIWLMRDLLMQWLTQNWGMLVLLAIWYIAIIPFAIFSLPPFLPSQSGINNDFHNLAWYFGLAFIYSMLAQFWWKRHQKTRGRPSLHV